MVPAALLWVAHLSQTATHITRRCRHLALWLALRWKRRLRGQSRGGGQREAGKVVGGRTRSGTTPERLLQAGTGREATEGRRLCQPSGRQIQREGDEGLVPVGKAQTCSNLQRLPRITDTSRLSQGPGPRAQGPRQTTGAWYFKFVLASPSLDRYYTTPASERRHLLICLFKHFSLLSCSRPAVGSVSS